MEEKYCLYMTPKPESNVEGTKEDEMFSYERLPDGTYSIRLKDRSKCPDTIVIPDSANSQKKQGEGNILTEAAYSIPMTVSAIADRGFSDCKELTSIHIPKSVVSIGVEAFSGSGLTEITVDSANPVFLSEGNCVIDRYDKKIVAGCSVSVIPHSGSVTSIGDYAFSGCKEMKSIEIPGNISTIGQLAFHRCSGIRRVTLEEGIDTIGYGAFSSCENLEEVEIPRGVRFIGAVAFAKCGRLKKATIPDSVEILGGDIFSECEDIDEIVFKGSRAQWKKIRRADIMDSGRDNPVRFEEGGFSLFGKNKKK